MNPLRIWVLLHHHRFGTSCSVFQTEATEEDMPPLPQLAEQFQLDYEAERDDEDLELLGPYHFEDLPVIAPAAVEEDA